MSTTSSTPVVNGTRRRLYQDLVAGVVVFLVALPLCIGIGHASGAPLHASLLAGIIGGVFVGLSSGSHVSVSGPAAGLAAIVALQIRTLGSFEAFLVAVVLAGALQIGFGLLRAGNLANFIPNTVLRGLLAAIGILLILKQIPHLFGHDADFEGDLAFAQLDGENTFSALQATWEKLLPGATLIGLGVLAVLIAWVCTPLRRYPALRVLVAVTLGTLVNQILVAAGSPWALSASHLVSMPVVNGDNGFAALFHFPDWSRLFDGAVFAAAAVLAVVASVESLVNLEATDKLDPLRRASPPSRELLAQGAGNVLAGLIGGLPVTAVIVRSSVNASAGAQTRLSTIVHGLLLLCAVAFLAPVINQVPLAALAAVLIVTGYQLAHPKYFVRMWQRGRDQFVPFLATTLAILVTDVLTGVLIGFATSLLFVLWRNQHGGFRLFEEQHVAGLVHRIDLASQVSFVNRAHIAATLDGFARGEHVAIDARTTDYIDPDVLAMIREFVEETAPARGLSVSLLGFKERYPLDDVIQYVDFTTRELQASLTPQQVLKILQEGNERFATGRRLQRDLMRQVDATSGGQHPMAVVLSCIDSRAPAEILFDLGIGDIFSVRVAGNVAKQKVLGSMEFACKVVGSKLIVVLGHTRCGAVKATCRFALEGVDPVAATGLTNLGAITSVITEAVHQEQEHERAKSSDDAEFVDRVAARHVHNTMRWIRANSPTLKDLLDRGEVGIVGAMYDVSSGRVTFFEGEARLEAQLAAARG